MSQNSNKRFQFNAKYFTISCYCIGVVFVSIIAFRMINNWESTQRFFSSIFRVISPYFIGFLIAYLVNPLVNVLYTRIFQKLPRLKSNKLKGGLAIFTSYLIVLGVLTVSISYIVPQLISSITDLIGQLPGFYNQITDWFNHFVEQNPNTNKAIINDITNNYLPHLQEYIMKQLQNIIPALYGAGVSIIRFLINFMIAIMVSIYMISDKQKMLRYLRTVFYALFGKQHSESCFSILQDCNTICKSFFIGKTIDSLIIGCLCFFIMSIFKLPYAMLISVIVGVTNMIPYFGPYIGAIPGILILFIDHPANGLIFAIIIICIQMFDGMILGPKILGNSTGLRPLVILFAISCGGAVAGPLGMFLGVPAFGIISYLIDKFVHHQLHVKGLDKENTK